METKPRLYHRTEKSALFESSFLRVTVYISGGLNSDVDLDRMNDMAIMW